MVHMTFCCLCVSCKAALHVRACMCEVQGCAGHMLAVQLAGNCPRFYKVTLCITACVRHGSIRESCEVVM